MAGQRSWSALGTYVHLAVVDHSRLDAAEAAARRVLGEVDRTCSRFRDDSDLVRLNRSTGRWVEVHPLLRAALAVAVGVARVTEGLVDPCLGRSLVSLGYDADLGVVRREGRRTGSVTVPRFGAWQEIRFDGDRVLVPDDVSIDLGSTAKAWASDLVAHSVSDEVGTGVLVSLGGDVAALPAASGTPWPVAVSERPGGEPEQLVGLVGGGLATSSTLVRRWTSDGVERHHLLDPRSGEPVAGPWRTATTSGASCVTANAASTAALVLGASAPAWLTRRQIPARLVDHEGRVTVVNGWPVAEPTAVAS